MEEFTTRKSNISHIYPFTNMSNTNNIPLMFSNLHKKRILKKYERSLSTLNPSTFHQSSNKLNGSQIVKGKKDGIETGKKKVENKFWGRQDN